MSTELPPPPVGALTDGEAALLRAWAENHARAAVEAEREACARLCDRRYMGDNTREDMEARRCAEAIRQRGKQ